MVRRSRPDPDISGHIVRLGVGDEPDVVTHLRTALPSVWRRRRTGESCAHDRIDIEQMALRWIASDAIMSGLQSTGARAKGRLERTFHMGRMDRR